MSRDPRNSERKVLVVEDSPTMVQLYRIVLGTRPDTQLIFAGNGVEALDKLAQDPDLELMIVDINMPQMDGLEFLARARSELGADSIPAIVISTEAAPSDREAAKRAGANGYLRKPWKPADLLQTIEDVLAGRGSL